MRSSRVLGNSCCPSGGKEFGRESYEETIGLELRNPCYLRLSLALLVAVSILSSQELSQETAHATMSRAPELYGICVPPFARILCLIPVSL